MSKNFPLRYLVTNTGWGRGLDMRPNPGIGFPGYVDYLPATRGTPQPPSLRHPGGTAPGPIPYPGAPPYGAQQYAPDGTPLYPGCCPRLRRDDREIPARRLRVGTVHAASAGGDPTDLRRPQPGVRTAATATKCPGAMTAHRVEKS